MSFYNRLCLFTTQLKSKRKNQPKKKRKNCKRCSNKTPITRSIKLIMKEKKGNFVAVMNEPYSTLLVT